MHQTGALFYILWGVLHLFAAFQVYKLASKQEPGMVQGRIYQSAWNLAFFALFVIVVALVYNWKNSALGYWLNLLAASITDIGFILYILVPGYLPLRPGILGGPLDISYHFQYTRHHIHHIIKTKPNGNKISGIKTHCIG